MDKSKLTTKTWGGYYRGLAPWQDELIPTSSVRELLAGSLDGKKSLSTKELETLSEFYNSISDIRFPTKWSGFANGSGASGTDRMQHPTSTGEGIWRDDLVKGDGNPHAELDRKRKEVILNTLEKEIAKGSSLATIHSTTIVSAISFTLNKFTAPATASNQSPLSSILKNERIAQVKEREKLKGIAKAYGATQETSANTSMHRPWGNRAESRLLSPPRIRTNN